MNSQKAISPAQEFFESSEINVRKEKEYVGRGAEKLAGAMQVFRIRVEGKICADIGAATGGFTQVLLQHGAKKVYAIDTAKGKLAFKLREDSRVAVMEGTDVRNLLGLPEIPELVTIDVSLISLRNILPAASRIMNQNGEVVALFKPQYEARDQKMLRHGIIIDESYREFLVKDFIAWAETSGWKVRQTTISPIQGAEGNIEYLIYLKRESRPTAQ